MEERMTPGINEFIGDRPSNGIKYTLAPFSTYPAMINAIMTLSDFIMCML
jgi:hypothetical protein